MIHTTSINLADVERACDKQGLSKDNPIRYILCSFAEQQIAQEQALNELKALIPTITAALAVEAQGMKLIKEQLNRVEKKFPGGMVTYEDIGEH